MKNKRIYIRVSSFELYMLKVKAKQTGLSLSSYLINSGLEKEVKARFSKEEIDLYNLLKEYQTNFKRLGNLIREWKNFDSIRLEITNIIQNIDKILKN